MHLRHHVRQRERFALRGAVGHVAVRAHVAAVKAEAGVVAQLGPVGRWQCRLGMERIDATQTLRGINVGSHEMLS